MKPFLAILLAAMVLGCDSKKSESASGSDRTTLGARTYFQLPKDAVLVSVNGIKLTKGDLESRVGCQLALLKARGKAIRDVEKARQRLLMTGIGQFTGEALLAEIGASGDAPVTAEERKGKLDEFAQRLSNVTNFEAVAGRLTADERKELRAEAGRQILAARGKAVLTKRNYKPIAADEVAKRRTYFQNYNRIATATNALIYAQATNVWKRLQSGESFESLYADLDGKGITVDETPCEIKASDYADDKTYHAVLTTTSVDVLVPPFEGDNGLLVLKMIDILPADASVGRAEPAYVIQRVFFELPEFWEVQTDEELRADVETIHNREAFEKGWKDLVSAAKVEYPSGTTNLFPRASQKRNRMKKGLRR